MTRIEKICMAVLILILIGTIIFWKDVQSAFSNKQDTVDNEFKNEKKEKDKEGDKKKDKDKSHLLSRNAAFTA